MNIANYKIEDIIAISNNAADEAYAERKDGDLYQWQSNNAAVVRALEDYLAMLTENEIYDLVYLYILGDEWRKYPEEERIYEYKRFAASERNTFARSCNGVQDAVSFIVDNIGHVSQYLRNAQCIVNK